MDKKVCAKCGAENAATRYFCGMCGSFLNMDDYEESHYLAHQLKLVRIADNLRHMSLKESIPDELYEHYAEKWSVMRLFTTYRSFRVINS